MVTGILTPGQHANCPRASPTLSWPRMDALNYHHLQYFWLVAKEGSIAKAAARLHVSQPTISTQLKRLETSLGKPLFRKRGRNLELTPTGRQAYEYADRIFAIGRELSDVLQGRAARQAQPFAVGVQTGLSAAVVDLLLRPALHLSEPTQLGCRTGALLPLVAELTINRIQLVLSAEPLDPTALTRMVCRPILERAVVLRGRDDLVQRYRRGFPKSLEEAPVLLPEADSLFRRQLEAWFDTQRIHPQLIAESNDPAFLDALAQAGQGLTAAPLLEDGRSAAAHLGPLSGLTFRCFAIHRDEPLVHPALTAVLPAAK
jgi:LysR family transcriptional regulator, transcriptional activator of nhaA